MIQGTQIVNPGQRTVLDLADGNRMELLSPPTEDAYCVMGTIPAGGGVPLHSHPEPESFYVLSGEVEALVQTTGGLEWKRLAPGDFLHILAGVRHAWRNPSIEPLSALLRAPRNLAARFRRWDKPRAQLARNFSHRMPFSSIAEISERYGHWLGSPKENAAVGIRLCL